MKEYEFYTKNLKQIFIKRQDWANIQVVWLFLFT